MRFKSSKNSVKTSIKSSLRSEYKGFKKIINRSSDHYYFCTVLINLAYDDIKITSFKLCEDIRTSNTPVFPLKFPYDLDQISKIFEK